MTSSAPVQSSLGLALGLVAGSVAVAVAWLGGAGTVAPVGLVTASIAAAGIATLVPWTGALVSASLCWAVYDGFALHRFGELRFTATDLMTLAIVATAACLTQVVAGGVREVRAGIRSVRSSQCRDLRAAASQIYPGLQERGNEAPRELPAWRRRRGPTGDRS